MREAEVGVGALKGRFYDSINAYNRQETVKPAEIHNLRNSIKRAFRLQFCSSFFCLSINLCIAHHILVRLVHVRHRMLLRDLIRTHKHGAENVTVGLPDR